MNQVREPRSFDPRHLKLIAVERQPFARTVIMEALRGSGIKNDAVLFESGIADLLSVLPDAEADAMIFRIIMTCPRPCPRFMICGATC